MGLLKDATPENRPAVIRWTYANSAARTGATGFVTLDLYTIARQSDDDTLWLLTATTPTWLAFGAQGPAGEDGLDGGDPTITPVDFTLLNGWTSQGSLDIDPGYYKQNGRTYLRGGIGGGSGDVAVLPSGFRPHSPQHFLIFVLPEDFSATHIGLLKILTDGTLQLLNGDPGSGGTPIGAGEAYFSGISFEVAP